MATAKMANEVGPPQSNQLGGRTQGRRRIELMRQFTARAMRHAARASQLSDLDAPPLPPARPSAATRAHGRAGSGRPDRGPGARRAPSTPCFREDRVIRGLGGDGLAVKRRGRGQGGEGAGGGRGGEGKGLGAGGERLGGRGGREAASPGVAMAYTIAPRAPADLGALLPMEDRLPRLNLSGGGGPVTVRTGRAEPGDLRRARELLNSAIEEGLSYPYEHAMDEEEFSAYFLSHEAFVAKVVDGGFAGPTDSGRRTDGDVVGVFYIKPNFPGRCDHICNGGFVVAPEFRSQGVGRLLGKQFLKLARALGYEAAFFNLVFEDNEASVRLWRSLGFETTGRVPQAARRGTGGYQDALQMRFDLTESRPTG